MLYQMSVQMFTQQLGDLMEKQKDGLYIPLSVNQIVIQFSVVPTIILLILTVTLSILLKSQIYMSIIFFFTIWAYTLFIMFMTVKNQQLLRKIYVILSVVVFGVSNLLL